MINYKTALPGVDLTPLIPTPEWAHALDVFGTPENVINYLYATMGAESTFDWDSGSKWSSAKGAFQLLEGTREALKRVYSLPPFSLSPSLRFIQVRYALAHLREDHRTFRRLGTPPFVVDAARGDENLRNMLSHRFYYHNGNTKTVPSKRISEIRTGMARFSKYYREKEGVA